MKRIPKVVDKQNQKCLAIRVRHVAAPDAEERRRRAVDLLLQAAARVASEPPRPAPVRKTS